MHYRQKRRAGLRVTPSFIRNLRKGYLAPDGSPREGSEREANSLLHVLRRIQEGHYITALSYAKSSGFDLEILYREYRLLRMRAIRGEVDFFLGLAEFGNKHDIPVRLRMAA